ncbi:FAD-dependent oxidoreductase [Streptomyces klenkii]|uniref:FAD-dependent oxidoreductase n=1 Tax=Streptomyces klenkii TaxID=1420899 RepID=UPI0034142855
MRRRTEAARSPALRSKRGHIRHDLHGHAVVIGAGMSGLLTAHALNGSFERVTVVERDRLDERPAPRAGVPQGRHAHALQAAGLLAFERLLPGVGEELGQRGAHLADFCRDARLWLPYGSPAPIESGIMIRPVSRPLLEAVVRERVLRSPGMRILDGCRAIGLTTDPTRSKLRVDGVRWLRRGGDRHAPGETLSADLVVDASGRSSRLPGWLADLGVPLPEPTTVDAGISYATRVYHVPPGAGPRWTAMFEVPYAPVSPRGCFALRIERDQLIVTLQGANGDRPPTDAAGFSAFAASLSGDLHTVLAELEPLTPIVGYAHTANRRYPYHRVVPWPDRLIAVGDAVCALNPIYAQGMTVAAQQALLLRDAVTAHPVSLDGLAHTVQKRVGRALALPWLTATLPDRSWLPDQAPRGLLALAHRFVDRYQRLVPEQPRMFHDIARVTNMLSSPALLLHPRHLVRIGATAARRTPTPAPPALSQSSGGLP